MTESKHNIGNVHSIETFGAFDGPGIRYVLFLQGCPFQCQYCHNRDTWTTKTNRLMSVSDIITDYNKYKRFYKKGGLTVSGGEPLLQMSFITELFTEMKKIGVHTCLDTSAACFNVNQSPAFEALMQVTDLVLLDIKHIDESAHRKLTGSTNKQVLAFAKMLDTLNVDVIIRHVLVPTKTDDENDLIRLRSFLDTLSNVIKIEVLPYHTKGQIKWEELGFDYPLAHLKEPSEEGVKRAEDILTNDYSFKAKV